MKRRFFGAVIALVAAASMSSSAGTAATPSGARVDLSTDAAVKAYLQSIGVDTSTVAIQRGARNYAGPFCPGTGWNCTTATSVVQIATPGGQNEFDCGDPSLFPQSALTSPAAGYLGTGRCLAIQDAAAGTNTIDIRKSRANGAALACPPAGKQQTSAGGQNTFNCHLMIQVSDDSPDQTATEEASIDQLAEGGGNHSVIDLQISLTSNLKCTGVCDQNQNAWQRAFVNQTATDGAENHSDVQETQYLRGRISGATSSEQNQNTAGIEGSGFSTPRDCNPDPPSIVTDPNSCAHISQAADGGHQESQLNLLNDLDARTTAASGSQNQGCTAARPSAPCQPLTGPAVTTGLDGTVPQPTTGSTDTSHEDYDERQNATAGRPAVQQNQTAPQSCCALQTGSAANSLVNADQTSTQSASTSMAPLDPLALSFPNPDAMQVTVLSGKIETDGDGTLTHHYTQNGGSDTIQCSPSISEIDQTTPACALFTVAVNGQPVTCGPGEIIVPSEGGGFVCVSPLE